MRLGGRVWKGAAKGQGGGRPVLVFQDRPACEVVQDSIESGRGSQEICKSSKTEGNYTFDNPRSLYLIFGDPAVRPVSTKSSSVHPVGLPCWKMRPWLRPVGDGPAEVPVVRREKEGHVIRPAHGDEFYPAEGVDAALP